MIQRGAASDPVLDQIVSAIAERVRPMRIILFGSRARGDARADSDYDILVELDTELGYAHAVTVVHDAVRGLRAEVDVLVRTPGELEAKRDDPGRMDWDVARQGVVVYAATDSLAKQDLAPRSRTDRVREHYDVPASVRDWLDHADVDLQTIDKALVGEGVPWAAVCFHAQQAGGEASESALDSTKNSS